MATWLPPRFKASGSSTVSITGTSTVLGQKAAAMSSNTFAVFLGSSTTQATDLTLSAQSGGLNFRQAHYLTGTMVDPTEDGQAAGGNTSGGPGGAGNKTAVDWAGKGCYDSQGKQVLFAGTGAFGSVADTPINRLAIYDETTALWSVDRGFAPSETTSDDGSGHTYDGNCIDVSGRRFFKKKFARAFYVKNLATNSWSKVTYSSGEPSSYGYDAGMEYIPSRDRLWIRSIYSANNSSMLMEIPPTGGTPTLLLHSGQLGSDNAPSVCSFNPRSYGGNGGCFVGGSNAYTVNTTGTPAATTNATGKPSGQFLWANGAHVCRDPVGNGWLHCSTDGWIWRLTDSGGTWQQRAQLPVEIRNDLTNNSRYDIVMVPIDAHGVIWIIGGQNQLGTTRAWLYKP